MNGAMVCAAHGGLAPQSRSAAGRRELERRAEAMVARLDVQPVDDPVHALLHVTGEVLALKSWLGDRFAEADQASQWLAAETFGRALDRASKLLVDLHRLGLEERRARMDEDLARGMADAMRGVVSDLGHDPASPEVRALVRRHLTRIDEPAAT